MSKFGASGELGVNAPVVTFQIMGSEIIRDRDKERMQNLKTEAVEGVFLRYKGQLNGFMVKMRQRLILNQMTALQNKRKPPTYISGQWQGSAAVRAQYKNNSGMEYLRIVIDLRLLTPEDVLAIPRDDTYYGGYIAIINTNAEVDDVIAVKLNGTTLATVNLGQDARHAHVFRFGSRALRDHSPNDDYNTLYGPDRFTRRNVPRREDELEPPYYVFRLDPDFDGTGLPEVVATYDFPLVGGPLNVMGSNTLRVEQAGDNGNDSFGHIYVEFYSRAEDDHRYVTQSNVWTSLSGVPTIRVNDRPMYTRYTYEWVTVLGSTFDEWTFDLTPGDPTDTFFKPTIQPGYASLPA